MKTWQIKNLKTGDTRLIQAINIDAAIDKAQHIFGDNMIRVRIVSKLSPYKTDV